MEILGSFLDEEWESLSKLFSCGENSDSLQHFDGSGLFSSNGEMPYLANSDQNLFFNSDHHHHTTFTSFSQESSNNDAAFSDKCDGDHQPYLTDNNTFAPMNYYNMEGNNAADLTMMPVFPDDVMEGILYSKGESQPAEDDSCKLKRKCEDLSLPESSPPKKIPRVARNKNPRKNKKKMQEESNNEEEGNGGGNRQSSSSCSSEVDSQELNGGSTSESKGAKSKAGRGSATDPQSLYARRRREKINERLKILQNLVPNGTKVDISTMLEEAVQYVKFLQLQIKLLSSDDMWMYAPIAYNGMDLSIYQKIAPNLMST